MSLNTNKKLKIFRNKDNYYASFQQNHFIFYKIYNKNFLNLYKKFQKIFQINKYNKL